VADEPSGVGIYSRELMLGLAAAHPEAAFDYYFRANRYLRSWFTGLPANSRRKLLIDSVGIRSAQVFHALNQRLPNVRVRGSVVTFHDLFVITGQYSTAEFRARFTAQARDAASRADAIIAVSAFTARQVVDLLNVDRRRVHVVHHGVRALAYRPRAREKVILTVGAVQVRKNIARLVEAFEGVDAEWRLVIAGSDGYGAAAIHRRIDASPARERIVLTGYVSPDELADWYSRALIFAFPSQDEGFGMPVLEAMSAGVPVVASDRGAIPEVCGNAALLVDAEDTAMLRDQLRELTRGDERRRELTTRGFARAREFTWEKAARQTWAVYEKLLK
jgi:glycosyltransferase involved in cell wall biosynthesis